MIFFFLLISDSLKAIYLTAYQGPSFLDAFEDCQKDTGGGTQAVGGGGALRILFFFFSSSPSSVPEMKTQSDTANLKRVVVKRVPGRGGEQGACTVMTIKEPSPRNLFAPVEMVFKATKDPLKEERPRQECVASAWDAGVAPGLRLKPPLSILDGLCLGLLL